MFDVTTHGNPLFPKPTPGFWSCARLPILLNIQNWKNIKWNLRSNYVPGFQGRIAPDVEHRLAGV